MIKDLFYFLHKPFNQWLTFLVLAALLIIAIRPQKEDSVWVIAGVTYFFFILINTLFIWGEERVWSYFFISLLFSIGYLFAASLLVTAYTKVFQTDGSGESSMMFLVILYHPFSLLLVVLANWLFMKFY